MLIEEEIKKNKKLCMFTLPNYKAINYKAPEPDGFLNFFLKAC